MEWHELPAISAKALVSLWLIASENDGFLPDIKKLAFRLRVSEKSMESIVSDLSHWLEQVDIKTISGGYQSDAPETETETEAEAEAEAEAEHTSPAKLPTCPHQSLIDLYHEVLPNLPAVRLMPDKRKKSISGFWTFVLTSKKADGTPRATTADDATAWVRQYFERARDNDFLMGRSKRGADHSGWECDLDFLLSDKGRIQVIEKTKDAA